MSRPYARAREAPTSQRPAKAASDWRKTYLTALADNCGQMTKAARAARVTLRTVQRCRLSDPEFKKAEAEALGVAMETAESEAIRRAIDGVERIWRRTGKDGSVHDHVERKYSDTILLRLLERLETGSWRQNVQMAPSGGITFKTRAERKAALEKARAALQQQPVTAINGRS